MTGRVLYSRRAIFGAGGAGREQAIRHLLVSRSSASERAPLPLAGWRAWLEARRHAAAARLAAGIAAHPDETRLIQGMMLGYRSAIPRALNRAFRDSGTIHIIAISGLHVVVIAALLSMAAARLGVPRPFWIVPQILDLGFVLSYMMVLGLIILAGPAGRLTRRALRVDRLAERVGLVNQQGGELAGPAWRRQLRRAGLGLAEWFAGLLGVSLAAWLCSIPLTAHAFGYFSTYSLLANLVVVPLSSLVMLLASLSLLVSSVAAPLGILCNQCARLGTYLMAHTAMAVSGWPRATFACRLPFGAVLLWYGILWALAWRLARAHARATADAAWMEAVRDQPRPAAGERPPSDRA